MKIEEHVVGDKIEVTKADPGYWDILFYFIFWVKGKWDLVRA